jgi:hypothetical protein
MVGSNNELQNPFTAKGVDWGFDKSFQITKDKTFEGAQEKKAAENPTKFKQEKDVFSALNEALSDNSPGSLASAGLSIGDEDPTMGLFADYDPSADIGTMLADFYFTDSMLADSFLDNYYGYDEYSGLSTDRDGNLIDPATGEEIIGSIRGPGGKMYPFTASNREEIEKWAKESMMAELLIATTGNSSAYKQAAEAVGLEKDPEIKQMIRNITVDEAQQLARLSPGGPEAVRLLERISPEARSVVNTIADSKQEYENISQRLASNLDRGDQSIRTYNLTPFQISSLKTKFGFEEKFGLKNDGSNFKEILENRREDFNYFQLTAANHIIETNLDKAEAKNKDWLESGANMA